MEYQQLPPDAAQPDMPALAEAVPLPDGFVYLDAALDGIAWEARYAGSDNFTGAPVDGYEANRIALSAEMVDPLRAARDLALESGYALLVWDAARPQRAVDAFVRWANAEEDGRTKAGHYPRVKKRELIQLGYIAKKSGHSRGAAIDLTLIDLGTGAPLDMGTDFDYMDAKSRHNAKGIAREQQQNREELASIMERAGFARYGVEWWHYSLVADPHPGTYFDFVIADP